MKTIYDFLKPRDPNKPQRPLPKLYKSPLHVRPDWWVCPLPVNFDSYRGCSLLCKHCYCRELDSTMYPAYWDGYDPEKVAPADLTQVEKLLKLASSEKETNNLVVRFLRAGVPIHMGNKSEPLIVAEENRHHIFEQALKLFGDYGYNVWVETKTGRYWEDRFLRMITSFPNEIRVGISIVPNKDFARRMEPDCDPVDERYESIRALNNNGIPSGIKAEPIMPTINDGEKDINDFFCEAEDVTRWVTFFNYKTKRRPMARTFFEQEGYDFDTMYEINQDDNRWREIGKQIFKWWSDWNYRPLFNLTSADIFTFPLEVNGVCCCGDDDIGYSKTTFQYVVEQIKAKGSYGWTDIEKYVKEVLPEKEWTWFRSLMLNRHRDVYTLFDCPEFTTEKGQWRKRRTSEYHGWGHIRTK